MASSTVAAALVTLHSEVSEAIASGLRLAMRLPPPWAALLAGAGVVFMLHGARHRHVLALPGGAVLGLLAARLVVTVLKGAGEGIQVELLWIAAGTGALACAGWPPLFPVAALALPGLLAGLLLPVGGRAWAGALAGAAGGALLGALAREWVAAMAAGGLGAAAALSGGVALVARRPIGAALVEHPMAVLVLWGVLTVAGAAFHAGRAWPRPDARRPEPEPYRGEAPRHEGLPDHDGWRG